MPKTNLTIRIVEINGRCPIYKLGDQFQISAGYVLEGRDNFCMHAIAALLPYYTALSRGISPAELGLCKPGENKAYVQCPDPESRTGGGTVVMEIARSNGP